MSMTSTCCCWLPGGNPASRGSEASEWNADSSAGRCNPHARPVRPSPIFQPILPVPMACAVLGVRQLAGRGGQGERAAIDKQKDRCTMTIGGSLRCNTRQSDGPRHVGCCSPLLRPVQRASLKEEGREHAANLARLS
ncbi:hypothetical protein GQ607_011098 [Colletotrichum asianum]|uniref:Uncharacterized protein n=1 Tax=Colletotrichum asianum TaxID=702518 RepID=A0A8H3W853_9PEZI|nr:hypothetical protein GQ607_011098 [Colletotrichum asianum]